MIRIRRRVLGYMQRWPWRVTTKPKSSSAGSSLTGCFSIQKLEPLLNQTNIERT